VVFKVSNTGLFDMNVYASSIVIEDGVMLMDMPDSVHLDAGAFQDFVFPANGSTYRFETEQVPYHPHLGQPMAVVEGCGENGQGAISTGFVNQFSMNDDDAFFDVECREVVGSYDPNDKHGFPRGYGDEHLIYPGIDLEYLINFQNTGNDTAFLVVIRDTLSEHLDITSVRPGAASHPYTWDIDHDNTLVFTFDNILLPDSTTNLEGSQGFIAFKIAQQADLPLGTIIENSAAIYFDINAPIITNTTIHKLGEDFIKIITASQHELHRDVSIHIVPNPIKQEAQFILSGWPEGERHFELFDHLGRVIMHQTFNGSTFTFRRSTLADGMYYFKIFDSSGVPLSGQLMLAE
jgi:uncharacterized repeat protein (TIGR01451 family)